VRNSQSPLTQWLLLVLLLVVVIAVESVALHNVFTTRYPGANDFFVRWLGGRAYLLEGTNPFDRDIAEDAQRAMFGRLTRPEDKDEAYFAYPLYTLYFFWPLSLLPYAWAQAIWMTLLQFMLFAVTLLSLWLSGWRPPPWLFGVTVFWGIFFYNGARSIILGQFSVLVGLALLAGLLAISRRRFVWAGLFLSVSTIKPQMVFLILLFIMLWALVHRHWRLIFSFGGTVLLLVLSSMLLVPTWPLDFIENAIAYSDYVAFGTPLENLLHFLLPADMAAPLTVILSGLFFLLLLPGWWLAIRGRPGGYTWAVLSTLIVGSLITFRSATTNQIILYLPIFFFFYRLTDHSLLSRKQSYLVALLLQIVLFLVMWGTFAITLAGNWEHVMMHGLLPALLLLLYLFDWRGLWRASAKSAGHHNLEPELSQ
jgi:hypothetical protein